MPINVSIKNVPDSIIEKLRQRAKLNHRSLQGELMMILEEAADSARLTVEQAEVRFQKLDFKTGDESVKWVRELRDAR